MPDNNEDNARPLRTTSLVLIATFATIAALYFGAEFLAPIVIAILLDAVFRPFARFLHERLRLPYPVGALVVLLLILGALTGAAFAFARPVRTWAAKAPETIEAAQQKLERFRAPVQKAAAMADKVSHAGDAPTSQPAAETPASPGISPIQASGRLLGTTSRILGHAAEILMLLYLLLASGDTFYRKLLKILCGPGDKQVATDVVTESQRVVLRYLLATAMINLGQAVVITLIMWWLKMPTPLLWGVFTFVFEFVPYLGAFVLMILLTATALTTFDSVGHILAPPAAYLIVSTLQNNLVSPYAYGNRLKLNPVAVLVGVLFWWYVWGIPGAFVAVPIVAILKVIADRVDRLKPVGEFLGE